MQFSLSKKIGFGLLISHALFSTAALADRSISNKLLLTGGVSQVEGAAGGGLTPWAVIGGYGTQDEIGANIHYTYAKTGDYRLDSYGVTIGFYDRFELSIAEQKFDIGNLRNKVASGLGADVIGRDTLDQTIIGAKLRVFGEAILDADSWMPQVAIGAQYKRNHDEKFIKSAVIGAKSAEGVDLCLCNQAAVSAKLVSEQHLKIHQSQSVRLAWIWRCKRRRLHAAT